MKKKPIVHVLPKQDKKIYFLSDFHLRANGISDEQEKQIVLFLDHIAPSASTIFFLGDVFDFWFEYKHVVPKGNIRIQHKWLELKEQGIKMYFFTGNHDQWLRSYFDSYFGMTIFCHPQIIQIGESRFLIGHGDGLGPSDIGYKMLKAFVTSWLGRQLLYLLHPDLLYALAQSASQRSREKMKKPASFLGEEKEWLIQYCKHYLKKDTSVNYFMFGHRHLCIQHKLSPTSWYINTGDWINHNSYAVYDGKKISLHKHTASS